MKKEKTLQEKQAMVEDLRPIDDVFFEVLAKDKKVCEEILRTILEDKELVVTDVAVQESERNLYGHSVRLDALCTLGNGQKCNIEVQRSDNDNHLKRVRFNASSITVRESQVGQSYDDVINLIIVYISEFDIFKKGKTIYHVDKTIRETGDVIDDGFTEIFVNTKNYDGTDIAELMKCFTQKNVNNPKFPLLSTSVWKLKSTEGGLNAMCEVMEKYMKDANIEKVKKLILKKLSKEDILDCGFTSEEYEEAEKRLLVNV